MAGSFGFEKEHYDVSVACGERVLLPAVRSTPEETLIVADGFSCREQISQLTKKQARHTAEVLQLAICGESASQARRRRPAMSWAAMAGGALAGVAAGFFLGRAIRR
jgi:hypothetical protein